SLLVRLHARRKGNLAHGVENEFVRRGLGELFLCVVNHIIRAKRLHQRQIRGTANTRDLRPEVFGKLYRGSTHRSGCSIDEDFLTRWIFPFRRKCSADIDPKGMAAASSKSMLAGFGARG